MRGKRRRDAEDADAQTVQRVAAAMGRYRGEAGRDAMVRVDHVLDLLNPRGMWSFDPEFRKGQKAPPADLDPLTGCRPVTAPEVPQQLLPGRERRIEAGGRTRLTRA